MTENQYVIFKLDQSEFGIDIMNVREIVPFEDSLPVPNTPKFVEGIINHRGTVIPIINLKKRFSLSNLEVDKDTRIIIVTIEGKDVGFIVDEASQTIRLSSDEIDLAPSYIVGVDEKYLEGVGKIDEKRLLIIIDLKAILSYEEIKEIQEIGE